MVSSDTNQPIAGPSLTQQRMLAKICKANKNRFQKLRVQILVCSTLPKTYQKHHHENSGFLSKCYYASQSTVLDIVFFIDWTSERSERVFYILYNGFWISLGRPIFEKLDFSVFFMSPPPRPPGCHKMTLFRTYKYLTRCRFVLVQQSVLVQVRSLVPSLTRKRVIYSQSEILSRHFWSNVDEMRTISS